MEPGFDRALLAAVVDHSGDAIVSVTLDRVIKTWNRAAERLYGYRADEACGQPIATVGLPGAERFQEHVGVALAGQRARFETRYARRDGGHADLEISVAPIRDSAGEITGAWSAGRDVTQRKRAERELARLADAAELATDAVLSIDLEGRVRHWNRGAEQLYGFTAAEAIGRDLRELTMLTDEPSENVARVLAGESGYLYEAQRRRKDGTIIEALTRAVPWRVDGRVVGVTGVSVDITERKRAEQATARLAAIVDSSDDAIIGKTLDGEITSWNAAAERIYGYSAAEALGKHVSILTPPGERDELVSLLQRVAGGEHVTHFETTRRRKDGRLIDVSVTISPIMDPDGRIIGAATVAHDITEHRLAERAREQALADLELAQRVARLGSWWRDLRNDRATWSAQMFEIFGRDPALRAPDANSFLTYVDPGDRERVAAAFADAATVAAGFELDHRIVAADGTRRTVHVLGFGDPVNAGCCYGTLQDVTEQRLAEAERVELLEASARAESANRAKSEFLARMSHELRTPLNSIIGFSQLVQLDGLPPRQSEHLGYVLKAAGHLLALIDEVLELARIESGRTMISPEPVALADTVREALALVAPLAREHDVILRCDASALVPDGHVQADRQRLKQALLNVLSNAIKYNRAGGQVQVSFTSTDAGRVQVHVADTGIGIAPERLGKLFEPFERLGAERTGVEGTGLGLALSKGLLEAMGATITVVSQPALETKFTIELAAAKPPHGEHRPESMGQQPPDLGPTPQVILYIEDNLSNLTLVERILERYATVELIPAMQAMIGLELAREHRPDLIVLDLHLPDLPGTEVLKRLKAEASTRQIPVVVLTADASKHQADRVRALGAADYLTKPIDVTKFLAVIAQNLGAAG
ncbi:MAG: PAS domain S-box protein [Solirubrobacteraceae bacterium]|jgi:PAS domain S-box-containing protein